MYHHDMMSTDLKSKALHGLAISLCLLPMLASGHSPHHLVTDIATAPVHSGNSHTYILITDQLFRSRGEAGPW